MLKWELERSKYNDEGRKVYDPETGYFVLDNYGGDLEGKVYDPDTGFYIEKK